MARPLRVAALALDPRAGEVASNLAAALDGLRRAAAAGAEVVALPEMWPTSFTAELDPALLAASDDAVARLAAEASALGVVAVGSAYAAGASDALPANRAHVVGAGGPRLGGYDKVHLFTPTAEQLAFRAGDAPPPVLSVPAPRAGGARLAAVVCYDLRFPDLVRVPVRGGVELLVVVAQWPDARAAAWRALVLGRAAEGQCFVLAANRRGAEELGRRRVRLEFGGHLLVAGPEGALRAAAEGAADLLLAELDLDEVAALRRSVPVLRDERRDLYGRFATES